MLFQYFYFEEGYYAGCLLLSLFLGVNGQEVTGLVDKVDDKYSKYGECNYARDNAQPLEPALNASPKRRNKHHHNDNREPAVDPKYKQPERLARLPHEHASEEHDPGQDDIRVSRESVDQEVAGYSHQGEGFERGQAEPREGEQGPVRGRVVVGARLVLQG